MAQLIGGLATSHIPAIGGAIHKGKQQDPYWKPFFDGFPPVRDWLAKVKPDVAVLIYNDHGLQFFLDKMPTFAVGAAAQYQNADEGWGIPTLPPYKGDEDLSWHLIDSLIEDEFDIVTCQEMLVDHAITNPLQLMYPSQDWGVKIVPVCINTVQFPLPSAKRCWALGEAVGRAIRSFGGDEKVVVMGSGGLSHQLDGERAGFINRDFDLAFIDSLANDPQWATQFNTHQLVELSGTQGVELAATVGQPQQVSTAAAADRLHRRQVGQRGLQRGVAPSQRLQLVLDRVTALVQCRQALLVAGHLLGHGRQLLLQRGHGGQRALRLRQLLHHGVALLTQAIDLAQFRQLLAQRLV